MKYFVVTLLLACAIGAQCRLPFFKPKNNGEQYNFEKLPDHKNYPVMARFIVHNANYTAVAYKSFQPGTSGLPMATIFGVADGTIKNGTGVPYFFLTLKEPAVADLIRNDSRCGLMMSLVQTGICNQKKWDPEDPRCARVFLNGKVSVLPNNTAEYAFAKKAYTERHPYFTGMPESHGFFYVKYIIDKISMISGFGGVRQVTLKDYYNAADSKLNLYSLEN